MDRSVRQRVLTVLFVILLVLRIAAQAGFAVAWTFWNPIARAEAAPPLPVAPSQVAPMSRACTPLGVPPLDRRGLVVIVALGDDLVPTAVATCKQITSRTGVEVRVFGPYRHAIEPDALFARPGGRRAVDPCDVLPRVQELTDVGYTTDQVLIAVTNLEFAATCDDDGRSVAPHRVGALTRTWTDRPATPAWDARAVFVLSTYGLGTGTVRDRRAGTAALVAIDRTRFGLAPTLDFSVAPAYLRPLSDAADLDARARFDRCTLTGQVARRAGRAALSTFGCPKSRGE